MTASKRPLTIGTVTVDPPLILAPMAGCTSLPLRVLCRRAGAGLVCTEMVSAMAIAHGNRKTAHLMAMHPSEHPVSVQLFGGEPDIMAAAVPAAEAAGADLIDINMGCGVPKVRRANAGVTLLGDPDRAVAVARAMVAVARVPITAKLRAGMYDGDDSYIELGRRLADVGVSVLGLHGRHAGQAFAGTVSLTAIERLIAAVPVPVIGSGDVFTVADVLRMLEAGCGGVMIARGALGRPWIFSQAAEALRLGLTAGEIRLSGLMPDPPWRERLGIALCHAQMLALYNGEDIAVHEMRGHVRWYTHGMPGGGALRGKINHIKTLSDLAAIFTAWAAPETAATSDAE